MERRKKEEILEGIKKELTEIKKILALIAKRLWKGDEVEGKKFDDEERAERSESKKVEAAGERKEKKEGKEEDGGKEKSARRREEVAEIRRESRSDSEVTDVWTGNGERRGEIEKKERREEKPQIMQKVQIMELEREEDKKELLKKGWKIKRKWGIGVDEDLTMMERKIRFKIVERARMERVRGRSVVATNRRL